MTTELPRETAAGFKNLKLTRPTPQFTEFLETLRTVQDLAVAVNAPDEILAEATLQAQALIDMLESHAAPEGTSFAGRAVAPGRGHLMLPAWRVDTWSADGVRAKGTFRRYHLGGNGAAHGGAIALLFDEMCGMAIFAARKPVARTAYLHVNYRNLTPLDVELTVETRIDRSEGRKRFVVSTLTSPDGTVLADAEALMIELPKE
ncbi:MAG: PaaI family thioesterase [Nocardiaceae bacterium]|nr:PaaI family thioesterase [Nocardiaceae bacterium]